MPLRRATSSHRLLGAAVVALQVTAVARGALQRSGVSLSESSVALPPAPDSGGAVGLADSRPSCFSGSDTVEHAAPEGILVASDDLESDVRVEDAFEARCLDLLPSVRTSRSRTEWSTVVASLIAAVAICFAVALAVGSQMGWRSLTVDSGSMTPTLRTGDLIVDRATKATDLRPGQIVTFHDPALDNRLVTHRIQTVRADGANIDVETMGDANRTGEKWRIARNGNVGRVVFSVPGAGRAVGPLTTRPVRVALIASVGMAFVLFALKRIWRIPDDEVEIEPTS